MDIPTFLLEQNIKCDNVAGVDEVGRGPLCGPVVAAAVIFKTFDLDIPVVIRDSKQMTAKQRQIAYDWLTCNPDIIWGIGQCSPKEIDDLNILWASMCAMERAVDNLNCENVFCLIDGNKVPKKLNGMSVVHGDAKSISIAAASIIAKETRDKIMKDLSLKYPYYGWDKNSGYPTCEHLQAIKKYGINDLYRKSFKPVKEVLNYENSDD